ncbi:sugar porter family MFS transporter [Kalamiella sp. sgz302252]|uniref:sugar porter family MFS transporter n=1 Tax=Pantoea sp. sgz302252 TaxID=3341827 RepID=UPI0036D2B789
MTSHSQRHNLTYVIAISAVAALGGLLFGYDSSVISGAIEPLGKHYQLTPSETGWAVSNVIIGCVIGCFAAGYLGDTFGRKKTLILTALLFIVSVAGTAFATSFTMFVIFRMIGGLGIGIATVISPVYIAEVAPKDFRGRAMTMHTLCSTAGQVVVLITNYLIVTGMSMEWIVDVGWRWMLGAALVPCALFFAFVGFIPETPRWNMLAGREEKALDTLTRISNRQHAENVLAEIKSAISEQPAGREKMRLTPRTLVFLTIGVGLAVFNQLTGINVIQYFGPSLLMNITGDLQEAMFLTILLAVLQMAGVIVGMLLIDKTGRVSLLNIGSAGAFICLFYTFAAFYFEFTGMASVLGLFGFMFIFGATWGQVVWTVIGEIFPTRLRAAGMGFSISAMWIANFLVSQTFPMMNHSRWLVEQFHGGFPLLIFAGCTLLSWLFVKRFVPETKGVALENMEELVLARFAASRRKQQTAKS